MPDFKRIISLTLINYVFAGTREWSFPIKRILLNWAGYKVGLNTKVVGPLFVTAKLSIGNNTWVGRNFSVDGNGVVEVGNNCDIGPNVSFYTGGHEIGDKHRRAGNGFNKRIIIKDGCWICAESRILPGIIVEESSVVAAGAVVAKNVKKDSLVGGVPAITIKRLCDE